MKVLLSIFFIFQMIDSKVEFYGKSYIVYDHVNDYVVESYNEDYSQSVASISKIMTAILVIENMNLDKEITVDKTIEKAYGSCVYIHINDKITIQDLLYGLMLRSGNDCALMLAKATAGSVDKFVKMMNEKAQELKMYNSLFSNPSGLDEEDQGNVSTVKDMALLYDYCCSNPIFNNIVKTQVYKRLDGKGSWHNKNRLLKEYKYCVGGKTGYTKKAKRTLITRAVKDDKDLIIVTFNCGNDFEFHKKKYEECFQNYSQVMLFDKGVQSINGELFFFDEKIYIDHYHDEEVSYKIQNNTLLVYLNHHCIKKHILQKYHFLDIYQMILKDLIYG